ncbi:MAG: PQQ-binding-like beta-propeller repeat protein [Verrucomicrobiota bacterium]|jgi:outer membrane protein assembly factor BamB
MMLNGIFCVALTLGPALVLGLTQPALGNDWPQWRGPNRNGISQESGWLATWAPEGPKRLWEASVGVGYSSFAVSEGRLYTMGNVAEKDTVFCLDALTGKLLWKYEYPCSSKDPNGYRGTRCTPTVDGDRVYTLSRLGHFFCLDSATGAVKWSKDFKKEFGAEPPMWGFAGSPLVERDWVLTEAGGSKGGPLRQTGPNIQQDWALTEAGGKSHASVAAFDKRTGEVAWRAGSDPAGYGSLIAFDLAGERCLLQFSTDHLICRKMKDGTEVWRLSWKTNYGANTATPIIHGDEIFISSGYNFGCALLKATPTEAQEVWRNKNMRNHVNSCLLLDGFLYGYDESELKCLEWKTGQVKWSTKAYGKGAVQSAAGKLILYGQNGKLGLAAASPQAFKEVCSFQALTGNDTWANPVLANGILYVRSLDKMAALDVRLSAQR